MRIALPVQLVTVVIGLLTNQAWAEELRVPVSGSGVLVLSVPDGWRSASRSGPVPTVSLTPASGGSFQVLVSPLVAPDGRLAPTSPELTAARRGRCRQRG